MGGFLVSICLEITHLACHIRHFLRSGCQMYRSLQKLKDMTSYRHRNYDYRSMLILSYANYVSKFLMGASSLIFLSLNGSILEHRFHLGDFVPPRAFDTPIDEY